MPGETMKFEIKSVLQFWWRTLAFEKAVSRTSQPVSLARHWSSK